MTIQNIVCNFFIV